MAAAWLEIRLHTTKVHGSTLYLFIRYNCVSFTILLNHSKCWYSSSKNKIAPTLYILDN